MKKNILFVIHKMNQGGAQKAASNILNQLSDELYNKSIFIFDNTNCQYAIHGTIIDGKIPNQRRIIKKIPNFVKKYRLLKKLKKDMDVCVSFLGTPNLLNIITKSKSCVTIISERNYLSGMRNKDTGFYKFVAKTFYRYADKIICVSKDVEQDLIQHYNITEDRIETINNFVDIEGSKEQSLEDVEKALIEKPYMVLAGRLHKQKGFMHAIEAYAKMPPTNLKMLILGEGTDRPKLEKQIEDLGLVGQVKLMGYRNNPFPFYANAQFFVLSSLIEGFPNVMIEAMACGAAMIATNCISGPKELLMPHATIVNGVQEGTYGILVPCFDEHDDVQEYYKKINALSEAMVMMVQDEEKRMHYKKMAQLRATDYSCDQIIQKWDKVIVETVRRL
jgi:glycosyltransferase involved in cell wall biosynthesis